MSQIAIGYGPRKLQAAINIDWLISFTLLACLSGWANPGGSISGKVVDPTEAVIPGVPVVISNVQTGIRQTTAANSEGFYSLPALPPGQYQIEVRQAGFRPLLRSGIVLEAGKALEIDLKLELGEQSTAVTVTETGLHVDTADTTMGETIATSKLASVPLNGRSFTDLLALQPGVVPASSQQANAVVMSGCTRTAPSGDLNAGNLSVSGQRETSNGFIVNGSVVEEDFSMGTALVPNLDSIQEFRVLTSDFDAEYGNYSGGQVVVTTKSGTNEFHGSAFDFLRQHEPRRAQLLFPGSRPLRPEPVWRHLGRAHQEREVILLRGLSRNAHDRGRGDRPDLGARDRGAGRRPFRDRQFSDGNGERPVVGRLAFAAARLPRVFRRALLHSRVR